MIQIYSKNIENKKFRSMQELLEKANVIQGNMNHLYTELISFNEYLDSLPTFDSKTMNMKTNDGLKSINSLLGFHVVLNCLIIELNEIQKKNCEICNKSEWLTKKIEPILNNGDENED